MKVKYKGPEGQVNYEVGMETGKPELDPGVTLDLSDSLVARLLDSSAWFEAIADKSKSKEDD